MWSPDGERLAFAGMHAGVLDLFVVTVATGDVRGLTDDAFAEVHPLWAPDGRSIVVATDRFTTLPASGQAGQYRLARVWLDGGRVEPLSEPWPGHMLNPQWADAAGAQLLFIGNRGGAPNLWRLNLASRRLDAVTDVTHRRRRNRPGSPRAQHGAGGRPHGLQRAQRFRVSDLRHRDGAADHRRSARPGA